MMRMPWPIVLSALLALSADLTVSHRARSLQPGEVALLTVESVRPLRQVRVRAFDRWFPAYAATPPLGWSALVGIDLDTKPGRYVVSVTGLDADGKTVTAEYPLAVAPKQFATRRLTVDEKFVSPPPEAVARIQRESARVRTILDGASTDRLWNGPFALPVPGNPISEFGKRSVYNGQPRRPHAGVDFAGAVGTPVRAPNAGKVVLAADLYYSGNTIILDHGQGLYSYFGHLSALLAREGDTIAAGDVVGRVGATGLVTGPHLHWAVWIAGTRVDPLSLVEILTPRKSPRAVRAAR